MSFSFLPNLIIFLVYTGYIILINLFNVTNCFTHMLICYDEVIIEFRWVL